MSVDLQIETTSTCQAACHFCVYPEAQRWGGLMTMPLYRKIIDEACTLQPITSITLTGLGEPALDPHLVERVRYARSKSESWGITVFTNGAAMTPRRLDQLAEAGLRQIVFSLNAVRQEQHERIMKLKDKFDIVCANIEHVIKNRPSVHVRVAAVINGDIFTRDDAIQFYRRWGHEQLGGYGQTVREGNWAGDNRTVRAFDPDEACMRAHTQIYVMWDGRVTTCCFDPTGKQIFGDLKTQSIRGVYNDTPYLDFRVAHLENHATKYAICATCTRI